MTTLTAICEAALQQLDPSDAIHDKEAYRKLYTARPQARELKELERRVALQALPRKGKIVFSGHTGTGKSTELYALKQALEQNNRATILYFSVKDHVDLVGLSTARLLVALIRAVAGLEQQLGGGVDLAAIDQAIDEAQMSRKRVRRDIEGADISVGAGIKTPTVLEAGGRLHRDYSLEEERILEHSPGPEPLLQLLNARIKQIREQRKGGPPVLLLVDDLEKLDLSTARAIFAQSLYLEKIDAAVVFTVPIALLYSEHSALLEALDASPTVLPIAKVRDRDGNSQSEVIGELRRLALRRIPELDRLLTLETFAELCLASGGVVRHVISLLERACHVAIEQGREKPFTPSDLDALTARLKREFMRRVPGELYPRLRELADPSGPARRGPGMDEALARLLNVTAVVEYLNDDTWLRVHPLARWLVDDAN